MKKARRLFFAFRAPAGVYLFALHGEQLRHVGGEPLSGNVNARKNDKNTTIVIEM